MSKSNHPLARLEFSRRVAKRAQYEAFEFTVTPAGARVRNCSHANPDAHEYLVTVQDGVPIACTCPADEHYDGACKHRVAVAIREPVLGSVTDPAPTVGSAP
ncbi:MAG: SWIM zinc finger family protein [Halorhabdus sp.]